MKLLILSLLSSVSWAACSGSSPNRTAANASQTEVAACITAASDGDTINVPAGTYTWSSPPALPDTKGLKIIGAGVGQTVITLSSTWEHACSTGKPHRISGFTFNGGPASSYVIQITGSCSDYRIDHNRFQNVPDSSDAIVFNGGAALNGFIYGVVDNNVFTTTGTNFRAILIFGSIDYGVRTNWLAVQRLGSEYNIFIEDNVFDYADGSNVGAGTIDSNSGAAFVFRYNTMTNSAGVTSHGVCNSEGTANQEAYGNTLIATSAAGYPTGTRLIHNQGSGEAMYFANRFTAVGTKSTEAINIQHYRSGNAASAGCSLYPRCDGNAANAAWDGNTAPTGTYYGYPCRYQPGRKAGNLLSPMYAWDNKWSDTLEEVPINVEDNWPGPPLTTTHVVANRDYYNYTGSFNGTSGVGVGTYANMPATCTPSTESGGGPGYWATDVGEWNSSHAGADGQLYRCSATNTWTLHYTPYAYPHPLRGLTALRKAAQGRVVTSGGVRMQ